MAEKVLIIDDEIHFLKLVESRLKANGYEVITARDGKEGLEKAKTKMPDLILLDIIMPKMDGRETLKRLRQDEDTKSIPVIMLTVKGEVNDIVQSLVHNGAIDYIVKPFMTFDFLAKIKNALQAGKEEPPATFKFLLDNIEQKIRKILKESREK